jgi:hypothetical protein
MKSEDMQFPVYRRYRNGRSYFKIINERSFEEVRALGERRLVAVIEARQFPEMIFIRDMLFNFESMAEEITAAEYERFKG